MDNNTISPLPPPDAPLAMMEVDKTPPRCSAGTDMPPPPDEKMRKKQLLNVDKKMKSYSYRDGVVSRRKLTGSTTQIDNDVFQIGDDKSTTGSILSELLEDRRYEEDPENAWNCGSWFEYLLVVILSTILLIGVLILTLFWIIYYRGGFAWSENPSLQFNLHPVLMIAGFVTFSGFSILLYRLCRCLKHIYIKLAHMFFHACAIPCIVVAFIAVYDFHNLSIPPMPNFYSLHSWLGFVTMGLFVFQFVVGFFCFLILLCCENATYGCRSTMVPIHASFGLVNFMLAIATCVTGLTEKALSSTYEDLERYIINAIGIVLVAIGIVISFAVRRSNAPATAKVYVTEHYAATEIVNTDDYMRHYRQGYAGSRLTHTILTSFH